jgi:hypothetical protein
LAARDTAQAEKALAEILEPGHVKLVNMDIPSFTSIRAGAAGILTKSQDQVNILVNNARLMGVKNLGLTEDGHEIHFVKKYLGHFLLFQLRKPALPPSSTAEFHSPVVNVASQLIRYVILARAITTISRKQ